jgi:hypothetical protein
VPPRNPGQSAYQLSKKGRNQNSFFARHTIFGQNFVEAQALTTYQVQYVGQPEVWTWNNLQCDYLTPPSPFFPERPLPLDFHLSHLSPTFPHSTVIINIAEGDDYAVTLKGTGGNVTLQVKFELALHSYIIFILSCMYVFILLHFYL